LIRRIIIKLGLKRTTNRMTGGWNITRKDNKEELSLSVISIPLNLRKLVAGFCEHGNETSGSIKRCEFPA
jgi:hypothetical protein